ncbi:phage tail tape measure protein [Pseudomonas protegens]|uniref:phage tail tape measure protein n=1 Tax=Pseudomonas protegens TaxID=380021 RepID=UPI001C6A4BAC|nr:phage tail tape measure protein [Pseudomonas protegens]QYM99504.1 phage tail tape measure protein [Pseudomonas protegens]
MTTIAELGIKVDSEDAVQASSNLDQMAAAGARVEKTTEALGETFDQARTRLLQLGKEAVAAKEAQAGLANVATGLSEAQQGLISSTSAAAQAQAQVAAAQRATVVSTDSLATSSTRASAAANAQQAELRALLEQIDPATRALNRLDEQERRLAQHKKLGLDQEVFTTYQTKIQQAREAVTRFDDSLTRTGNTAKQTAAALRGVPAQFTDIVVSLQGGQAPLTVLLQQGGQLKDMFGGIGPAIQAVGGYALGLVNPFTVAAAAVTGLAVAAVSGINDLNGLNKALVATGGAAGRSSSQLIALQESLAKGKYFSQANEALLALVQSGKLTGDVFDAVAAAATQVSAATGESASGLVKQFVDARKDVSAFALEFNSQYHAIKLSTFDQIQALQDQGRSMDALKLLAGEVSEEMNRRNKEITESTRGIAKVWDEATGAVRRYWNELKQGVAASPDQFRLQVLQQQVEDIDKQYWFSTKSRDALKKQYTDEITLIQKRLDASAKERQDRADSEAAVQKQAELQKRINDQLDNSNPERKRGKALKDLKQQFIDLRDAAKETGKQSALLAGVTFDGEKISGGAFDTLAKGIEDRNKDKKPAAYHEDAGTKILDQARQRYAVLQQQNVLIGAQRGEMQKLGEAGQALVRWEQQLSEIKDKKTLTADQKSLLANQELITTQLKKNAALEREMELRKLAADEAQKLAAFQTNVNSQLQRASVGLSSNLAGAGMGDVERQRMQERLSIEQQYQQQMDNLEQQHNEGKISQSLYEKETNVLQQALDQRLAMQEKYYQDVDAQQQDWSLGARSAFASYLEQARDVAGQTRALFTNAFGSMEDAIVQFAMTGKFSFADFTKSVLADMARIAARQAASSALSSLFGMAASAAASYFGGPASAGSTQAGYTGVDFSGYRAAGGPVAPNSLYEVNELGPELYNEGGRSFLMTGANGGSVTPLTSGAVAGAAGANGGGASGSMIQVNAPVSLTMQDRSSEGMQLDQQALQQNMQKQMLAAAQKAVDESWRPGGTSYMKARGRG